MRIVICFLISLVIFKQSHAHERSLQSLNADSNIIIRVISFNWMPDGKELLLSIIKMTKGMKTSPDFALYKYNIISGKLELQLTVASNPAASPDGKKIAYAKRLQNQSDIYVYDLKTKE